MSHDDGAELRPVASAVGTRRRTVPRATMRLQLHRDFDFDAAAEQVPYLAALGISHLYSSPILTARAGSAHGYDIVDPTRVNPELGGEEGLRRLVARLREHGMGLVADIVPNHLAVGGDDNAWWLDVLEWGRDSFYAGFFDIDWDVPDPALQGRVCAPFLGKPYGEALAAGDIRLCWDAASGRFHFRVHDSHRFPLAPRLYAPLLRAHGEVLGMTAHRFREATSGRRDRASMRTEFEAACRELAQLGGLGSGRRVMDSLLATHAPDLPDGPARLHRLLERQAYRLAWWRTAPDEINWRRFFDVTTLAGLRIQTPAVFEAVHATTLRLYVEGLIDGVRVDHVDGLADPRAYCRKLRRRLDHLSALRPASLPAGPAYLVVEKILAPGEQLARDWRTDGTSGYVFMNEVSAVLHDAAGREPLAALWRSCSGRSAEFEAEEREARRRIPQTLFTADFNACALALHQVARSDPATRDWTLPAIRRCLTELLVHFPVYRTYADARGRSAADAALMARVIEAAAHGVRAGEGPLLALIDRWLGGEPAQRELRAAPRRHRLQALARFQQLTSPVAAKSVEDTAFYRFGVLLSRNEVGANPDQFALSPAAFHRACAQRARRYPAAMLATATHDHKRGEDLRARLAVLSEIPQEWARTVLEWRELNAPLKAQIDQARGPDAIDEYVLYQMMVGAWPLDLAPGDRAGVTAFGARLREWQLKAVREAKRRSGWMEPNLAYEQACDQFLQRLLDSAQAPLFLAQLAGFVDRLAPPGALNALGQTLLRLSTPGVPDTYQGTEYWDFSLVDPDNRRPVDFGQRRKSLAEPVSDEALQARWRDGRIKQALIARTLALRCAAEDLFAVGAHVPLSIRGPMASHLLAFARELGDEAVLVIVPLRTAALRSDVDALAPDPATWEQTWIELPARWSERTWGNALAGQARVRGRGLHVVDLLRHWPLALLHSRP